MKFKDYLYERPDINSTRNVFKSFIKQFKTSDTCDNQKELIREINKLRNHIDSMFSLVEIRHTINTEDTFYRKEREYLDEFDPLYKEMVSDFYRALVESKFRESLEQEFGKQLFALAENQLKTISHLVIEDLQRENKLNSDYIKLTASAKINFEGRTKTLSQLYPLTMSPDRSLRKKSSEARFGFFQENKNKLDLLFDELVKVRTTIAQKLGFENFVKLGYARLGRTDYKKEDVAAFRKQIKEHVVPLVVRLKERQRKRIGVEELYYYDEDFFFTQGNPTPKGNPDWVIEQGERMYQELSNETDEFFRFMVNHDLMDLLSTEGKAPGGYCTYIPEYKSPFIYANFNGTAGDIDVLTHEAGHALQVYSSRDLEIPEYYWPTYEASEIHSMSMEFFTWPWMENFFGEDTDRYKFSHLSRGVIFLPYCAAVDEFQHYVYENPTASSEERNQFWLTLEEEYLPHLNHEDNSYLKDGGYWQKQLHIFTDPFYYIDYGFAQMCAFQFWKRMRTYKDLAWKDYIYLCSLGGSRPFTELVEEANLVSPFNEGCVLSVIKEIENWLDCVKESELESSEFKA
ncbi:M3 family oligoendopeptidase [Fictibacillus sp. BK138]|uniref:M3 family oligoendopeptidase n=1 Tax=Fictibacillus sp. BK138 TaxID=2512121 RepID=UPI001028C31C|nr:M3 family oligoendopeptidase [Fictibacillus sp. BK138]RZT15585.1 M3 family oligoendopeptidase [Fictibacillus sp. BK138]